MRYPLAPNDIFWTLQGEGALQGTPMLFVRLAGCSVGCPQCDTDYRVDQRMTAEEIHEEARGIVSRLHLPVARFQAPWVWITGGEPTDHNLESLIDVFRTTGWKVALATAGVRDCPLVDWISVSPHGAGGRQRLGHEVKVVPGLNGLSWDYITTEVARWSFPYKFIQPLSGDQESIDACIEYVKTHPGWRLTIQAHKYWNLP